MQAAIRSTCQHGRVDQRARELAERLLAGSRPRRWRHVQAVAREAERLCTATGVDPWAVVQAGWLHDIGYSPSVAATGFHPLDGARYVRALGWDERVCRLVAHHTDARHHAATKHLADMLGVEFPGLDGLEQDVLWAADATCGPSGERLSLGERIAEVGRRYGRDHAVTANMNASRAALAAAIDRVAAACR